MERRHVEYFLAVVDHGGFTAAARALFVAQPSLSYAIKALEKELGTELFDRLPGGARLTAAGRAFVEPARQVLRAVATARATVQEVVGVMAGTLDLVALPVMALDPLGAAVAAFRAAHPGVVVRLGHAGEAAEIAAQLRSGTAELGFADVAVSGEPDLRTDLLGRQALVLASPPGTAPVPGGVPLDQLVRMPLIASARGGAALRHRLADVAHEQGVDFRFVVEVGNRESAVHLVVAGAGSAVLPEPLARLAEQRGATVSPLSPPVERELYMVRRAASLPSPAARRFSALVLERSGAGGRPA